MCLRLATVLDPPVGSPHGADRANRTSARIEDKVAATQQKTARSIASGWGSRPPRRFDRPERQQIHLHGQPGGTREQICYPIRTAAPLVLRRQQDRCRRTCPNGRITTALVDPDGSGLVTKAIPDPTLHAWWEALISTR
jgi:hypothetical protein